MEVEILSKETRDFLSVFLLFAAWYSLVIGGMVPADQFVNAIGYAVGGIFGYHVGANKP